jgi:hypothetical protein
LGDTARNQAYRTFSRSNYKQGLHAIYNQMTGAPAGACA